VLNEASPRPSTSQTILLPNQFHLIHTLLFVSDELAHVVIPLHPKLKPHARMLHHFRFLTPLLSKDEDGLTPLHYYDSAIQLVRNSAMELTEGEFEFAMNAADQIVKW